MIVAIICAVVGLLLGAGIYYLISRVSAANLIKKAEEEAEVIKKNKIVEAKEKFIALKLEHDNSVREQDKRLATANAMTSAESSEEAIKRLNALIAQVDRAIAALKK